MTSRIAPLLLSSLPAAASAHALDHLRQTNDIGPNKAPHLGVSHILVIPTRVGVEEFPANRWRELQRFYNPEGGPNTFRGYWRAVSNGRYDPIPTLASPVLYPKRCPIPGKTVDDCKFALSDLGRIQPATIIGFFRDLIESARDNDGLDLSHFDVNTGTGPGQDGWFDGLIVDSDILSGIGLPLNAFGAAVRVEVAPRPPMADAGIGADAGHTPPDLDAGAERPVPPDLDAGGAPPPTDAGILPPPSDASPPDATLPIDAAPAPDAALPVPGTLAVGNVAMIPPDLHEFGHVLGFIDLYNGMVVNDLMGPFADEVTLGAFSRQQVGWGEVEVVDGPGTHDLRPVMEGGRMLRFGEPPRYLLIEHRGGPQHEIWDASPPGINVYSVDEDTLPTRPLGFLDLAAGDLYYPNAEPPYLDVNMPLGCTLTEVRGRKPCVAQVAGELRALEHASGQKSGMHLRIDGLQPDGSFRVTFVEGDLAPPPEMPDASLPFDDDDLDDDPTIDAGADAAPTTADSASDGGCACDTTATSATPLLPFALLLLRRRRSRR